MESDNMVTVLQHCQVSPPPGTTSEKSLPLTFFDLRMIASSAKHLFFFECTSISKNQFLESIIPSLKHSLSLSLKYYYPFAGNLIFPPNSGKPEIRYLERDSASLIFAESSSDFIHLTGKQTRNTTEFLSLLPQLPPESMSHDTLVVPISSFQVTLFPDSGICVGFHLRHAIGDGHSVVKSFFKTWASITKAGGDATFLSGEFVPYYDRTRFRDPEGLEFETIVWNVLEKITKEEWSRPHHPKPNNKVRATFVISHATAQQLKKLVLGRYPFPSHISTFTVTCGYVWSCLAKARAACGEDDNEMVHFLTEVDWRTRMDPPLPATYFGNCVLPSLACAKKAQLKGSDGFVIGAKSIGDAIHKSLHHTGGVSKTVKNLAREREAASKGWLLECFSSPKFKMYDIDFGWGRLKTNEELSIDDCEAIAVGDGQNEGETEIILSSPKPVMDAFVSIFSLGLQTLDEEVKKLGANNFTRSKI